MSTFDDVLRQIRAESTKGGTVNKAELGRRFEAVTRDFLSADNHYRNRFAKVSMWMEWPGRDGGDTGIDLVAEQHDGSLCAIQCKCYADDGSLDTKQVSKFLAKAAGMRMQHRMLVYTGECITANAKRLLEQHGCQILSPDHFRASRVDWGSFPKISARRPKTLRPHQKKAVSAVTQGLAARDRGQLVMACGTGKTLTSLHVAEKHCKRGGLVLYLVPSISLILQSMREWSDNSNLRHYYLAVCSDKTTGEDGSISELEAPVSTNAETLAPYLKNRPADALTVVFSTYHSLGVVRQATKSEFDLILCDEAHRTTGAEDKSFFTDVHSDSKVRGKKRLYMTATPRVYSDAVVARTGKVIYSMDDEQKYGPQLYRLSFAEAVRQGILSDFRVKIAIVPADRVDKEFQQSIGGKEKSMNLDERTLMAAVWHGINYPDDGKKPKMLRRLIAFANRIDRSMMFAGHVPDGEGVDRSFESVVTEYEKWNSTGHRVEVDHIDGKTKALQRRERMRWLDGNVRDPKTCRVLSNARCLAEGVDVPALDGVVFLNPRKSRVDVVQSVGRVMRKSEGKKYGYVILPVAIPAGLKYHEALDDNKTFRVVWQVLNALRSHDEDLGHEINRLILDKNTEATGSPRISVSVLDETVDGEPLEKFFSSIKSKLVEKVGDINYYDKYGEKLGAAARTIETRILNRMKSDQKARREVEKLHAGLKEMVGDSVTLNETARILAQHVVLSRVFDQLFSGEFTTHNPIAKVLDSVSKKIGMTEELRDLAGFYKDVSRELDGIKTRIARQNFIKKIYGNFLESADKKAADKHGIVYTPVEVVDFIIHSVEHLLKKHFGVSLNDRTVKVLDPFAGAGTFLTRLLESGLVDDNIYEKYKNDMFAGELMLLAYYVATVNIETTYSSLRRGNKYVPFSGISYADTLRIDPRYRGAVRHRQEQYKLGGQFQAAHERIRHQRSSHVHVIIGNPPYSAGQKSYNDENQNIVYSDLDARIRNTYLQRCKAQQKASLYDSYIRSLRWASDRIGHSGIVAVITNAGFLRSEAGSGIRASLAEEFNEIWCLDLRGNARTQDVQRKKEGDGVFGQGSRAATAITILTKSPHMQDCAIRYHDIGDYLTQEQKLDLVKTYESIDGIGIQDWQPITPDKHHDWLNPRGDEFEKYMPMGDKDVKSGKSNTSVFKLYSNGVKTNRDSWVYNSSKSKLATNMTKMIKYCNQQNLDKPTIDPKYVKWDEELGDKLRRLGSKASFDINKIRLALYRPFFKQYLYFDQTFNSRLYLTPQFFPDSNPNNLVICVPDKGKPDMFSVLVTNITPDLHLNEQSQCFPLKSRQFIRRNQTSKTSQRQAKDNTKHVCDTQSVHNCSVQNTRRVLSLHNRRYAGLTDSSQWAGVSISGEDDMMQDNITDYALHEYRKHYRDDKISKLDIFYYVYGILHHQGYREKFANNLTRDLPRIPLAPDFKAFSCAGRNLADLHLGYETCKRHDLGKPKFMPKKFIKLSFGWKLDGKKRVKDRTVIRADGAVLFDNVPETSYRVNGRTPIAWIVDKYRVTTNKESGLTNDPCMDTDIVAVIERAVHIGLESERIIKSLPEEFEPAPGRKPSKGNLDDY